MHPKNKIRQLIARNLYEKIKITNPKITTMTFNHFLDEKL